MHESENLFWDSITSFLTNKIFDYTDIESWVLDYSFDKLNDLDIKIEEKQENISILENEKSILEKESEKYQRIRNVLLYQKGDLLKNVCKQVLNDLGINAMDGEPGREDLYFIYNNEHYLIEVKGSNKSANKDNVKQIIGHKAEYTKDKEVNVKWILVINAWRTLPIEERETKDKTIFPNEIKKLVVLSDITLITSQQLFVAYCENLEGTFDLKSFVEEIKKTKGKIDLFNNIKKYKKEIPSVAALSQSNSENVIAE